MRSEVVKVGRRDRYSVHPDDDRVASQLLSDLLPEIQLCESKSVRISVEIVEEKGEEKVGSKCELTRIDDAAYSYACLDGIRCPILDHIVKDWQPGESRKVKSILFDTPSGVPEVTFIETPRERLKREFNAASILDAQSLPNLYTAVNEFLAATEGEGK